MQKMKLNNITKRNETNTKVEGQRLRTRLVTSQARTLQTETSL